MPAELQIAVTALGLTVIVQAVGIGVVYGVITTKLNGVRKEIDKHEGLPPSKAHSNE